MKIIDPDRQYVEIDGRSVIDHAATAEKNAESESIAGQRFNDAFASPGAVVAAGCGLAGVALGNPVLFGLYIGWLAFRGVDLTLGIKNVVEMTYHQSRAGADALKID
jgi:hypothetical protein